MRRLVRIVIIVGVLAALVVVGLGYARTQGEQTAAQTSTIEDETTVETGDMTVTVSAKVGFVSKFTAAAEATVIAPFVALIANAPPVLPPKTTPG